MSKNNTRQPEAVDVFLRTFLFQMGMSQTLDCFQAEWNELEQKGLRDTVQVDAVPDIYSDIQRLEIKLKNARKERKEYKRDASTAAETLVKAEKTRDFHRMHHQRVIQERDTLFTERRRLRNQCDIYEPAILRMNEKCERLLQQNALLTLKRDNKCFGPGSGSSSAPRKIHQPGQTFKQKPKQSQVSGSSREAACQ